jgi:anti-sigma B factor antagonist
VTVLAERPRVLVFDLTGVTFISSAGLGVLVRAHQAAAPDTRVRVVAAERRTLGVLRMTGLDDLLDVYDSRAHALHGV